MIRPARSGDTAQIAKVFHRAIREGESPYSEAERAAWSPQVRETDAWQARLAELHTLVFEEAGHTVGFVSWDDSGYVDLAFILPEARGRGVFRALLTQLESVARDAGATRLRTHASLMAQPAFRAVGFEVVQFETVQKGDQRLRRAHMEKRLS